ncbi:MAG: hypothetical protein JSV80_00205 [Acidobacteriota bacterium]|nr:MAG: hypothetical protein JSV80_00205 [Acidobacteriota bacterium]
MTRYVLTAAIVLSLASSAVPAAGESAAARDAARILASFAARVSEESRELAAFRDELLRARERNIGSLEQSALRVRQHSERRYQIWNATGQFDKAALFDLIGSLERSLTMHRDELDRRRAENEATRAAAKSALQSRQDRLAEAAKLLGQLAERPSLREQLSFYAAYFRQVRQLVDEQTAITERQAEQAALATGSELDLR